MHKRDRYTGIVIPFFLYLLFIGGVIVGLYYMTKHTIDACGKKYDKTICGGYIYASIPAYLLGIAILIGSIMGCLSIILPNPIISNVNVVSSFKEKSNEEKIHL